MEVEKVAVTCSREGGGGGRRIGFRLRVRLQRSIVGSFRGMAKGRGSSTRRD